ncbi:NeuD/PglB/VioB family sugar acetyltransferase [Salinimicrobium tongyeongense]|uniref:NeuD/PglB/VioB family sugar acetyltransferase n=1 Tax=Salinimicrobium tongyeongense TaxID=2809707 RepID=A0ABY6NSR4_9FLAO|nr:NeuD/PglB/VioB family sugar acetyltransferase [Salinimicrobium tongyeongense]UZH55528.1 NeuD/PglB/VioB family sugar acetyltransferase [Salinimicrobium tongyeongense]
MNKKKEIIIVGTGGHAKVIVDMIHENQEYKIIGFTTINSDSQEFCGYPVLGDDSVLSEYYDKGLRYAAIGVGAFKDNTLRRTVFEKVTKMGFKVPPLIDASCIISKSAVVKEGAFLARGVILNNDVKIGKNTVVYTASSIDHETLIGDHVLISAGVTIGAYTNIEEGVLCALGSKVVSGVRIGKDILVGAGAVVVNNIEKKGTYLGCPAKKVR